MSADLSADELRTDIAKEKLRRLTSVKKQGEASDFALDEKVHAKIMRLNKQNPSQPNNSHVL